MFVWRHRPRHASGSILTSASRWITAASLARRLREPVQSYLSTSDDPYLNLSIEHYLFQKSDPESVILFQYVNRPSIIIGRNQNPWFEVNLALLDAALTKQQPERRRYAHSGLGSVDLVRRRSGGGTVFHDEGNVNWTVICPSAQFTRDKHAEMIVRALRERGIDRARVNSRHDIVLDQGDHAKDLESKDEHITAYTMPEDSGVRPLKVSGSAYKLTRGRALHHGTCLLSSPNLNYIPHYLHSPAKPYIQTRGVESVSSPVANILLDKSAFIATVQTQFSKMYSEGQTVHSEELGKELLTDNSVAGGYEELKSLDWTYLQTPQFTVSHTVDTAARLNLEIKIRHGAIESGNLAWLRSNGDVDHSIDFPDRMVGQKLHEITSWNQFITPLFSGSGITSKSEVSSWLETMLPVRSSG